MAIDPHSVNGDTFVFIKKQKDGEEADFVLHFPGEDTIFRPSAPKFKNLEPNENPGGPEEMQQVSSMRAGKHPRPYRWARSKHTGRPHPKEPWELILRKDEMLKVIENRGNKWFIVSNSRGIKGWAHSSWLSFRFNHHADPGEAYSRYVEDMESCLKPGQLRSFPEMSRYMDSCAEEACKPMKQEYLGICSHDLARLLRGSGHYTRESLKEERNKWHPDKFARFCHPESRDKLRKKAEAVFVLHGVLIDMLENSAD